ncbi:hypothetical protein RJ527_04775 [Thalassospiraceae bacterium LMO-SO8]|nr:hypothetical protein [Alphaproteobacteria bacterium LMO-S08]WND77062.1 hypothetical protein RJ527_04775 [Thalassospiraceae bacterium LMO-SO8]
MGMVRAIFKFFGWIEDIHDTYVWCVWVWGAVAGVGVLMIAIVEGLPLATKVTLSFVMFAAALTIWFILSLAPSKTVWGRRAKRRRHLNGLIKDGIIAYKTLKTAASGDEFQDAITTAYGAWAATVWEYLRSEYDEVVADRWATIGFFTKRWFRRASEFENGKLTEVAILIERLQGILAKEDGDESRQIPQFGGGPQNGSS